MVAPNYLFHYNIRGVACCTTAKNSPCGLSSGGRSSNPHYPCSIPLFSSLVVVSSLKSKFICCCKYFSAYHCLYDFPLIHQSNIASAISSSDHCPASTPPDAGLSENPPHFPLGNDILRVCCPIVVLPWGG